MFVLDLRAERTLQLEGALVGAGGIQRLDASGTLFECILMEGALWRLSKFPTRDVSPKSFELALLSHCRDFSTVSRAWNLDALVTIATLMT